jgi:hypothetical protein
VKIQCVTNANTWEVATMQTHTDELTNHVHGPWFVHTWHKVLAVLVGCQPTTNPGTQAPHSKFPAFHQELVKLRQELDPA